MAKKEAVKTKKKIKKSFYEVKAPLVSTKMYLYGSSIEELVGRVIKVDLTKALRGKSLELKFKVKAEGNELHGVPVSVFLSGSYIRRMMRRGIDYVEDSFETECRNKMAVIKPFMITRNKVSRAVRRALRETTKKYLTGYLKTRNAEEILSEIVTNKLQKDLSLKLKKVYPLALCEIRVFEIGKTIEKKEEKK